MKYLFVLGRNPKLSIEEIKSYLIKTNNPSLSITFNKNSILVQTKNPIPSNTIDKLGGTIVIGEVIGEGKIENIIKEIENKNLHFVTSNKLNYVVWDFSPKTEKISQYLKQRFKQEKLKATEKRLTGQLQTQDNKKVENIGSKLIQEQYFLFEEDEQNFGRIIQKTNYSEIEKRDMLKPVRRPELSISPRLAKIMINLSQANKQIVDPFCGIGIILTEAILQDLSVIGVDKDKEAIDSAKKNLAWNKFNQKNYLLINNDSSKVRIKEAQTMVTEPDFGETLKKSLSRPKAEAQIKRFENLMINVLNNMKKYVSDKFVFSAPLIRISKFQRISCNIENILEKTSLKLAPNFPIQEFRPEHIVGREIYVLEKS